MKTPAENGADERLRQSVISALARSRTPRPAALSEIEAEVRDGIVTLRGYVGSDPAKYAASATVRALPGVQGLENRLDTDEGLERRVAQALAACDTTRENRIVVNVIRAGATLYGIVPSHEAAEAARAVALTVSGIREVMSRLRVVTGGEPPVVAWQNSQEWQALGTETGSPAEASHEETAAAHSQGDAISGKEKLA